MINITWIFIIDHLLPLCPSFLSNYPLYVFKSDIFERQMLYISSSVNSWTLFLSYKINLTFCTRPLCSFPDGLLSTLSNTYCTPGQLYLTTQCSLQCVCMCRPPTHWMWTLFFFNVNLSCLCLTTAVILMVKPADPQPLDCVS